MVKLFDKLFCKHRWTSHSKNTYSNRGLTTVEILICSECGKVKVIEY